MRFFLDHNVPESCRAVLVRAGHQCITTDEVGRATADDDDQTVYATDHGYVVVTRDSEYTTRRKANAIGRHVRLKCRGRVAHLVLAEHLDEILELLHRENVTVVVSPNAVHSHSGWR